MERGVRVLKIVDVVVESGREEGVKKEGGGRKKKKKSNVVEDVTVVVGEVQLEVQVVEEVKDVEPIVSRKTKKKKIQTPKMLPVKTKKVPDEEKVQEVQEEEVQEDEEPKQSLPDRVAALDPSETSVTIDAAEISLVFEKVLEKSAFLVAQLRELNFDGRLVERTQELTESSQMTSILGVIRRLSDPICALAKCADLGRLVKTEWHPQSAISKTVIDQIAIALYSVHKTAVMLREGLQAKLDSIRHNNGRKKTRKMVAEWSPFIDQVGSLERSSMQGLESCYDGGAEPVSESQVVLGPAAPVVDDSKKELSVEEYLDELLLAVHDFVYIPESGATPSSSKKLLESIDDSSRRPWVALAVATGLDPDRFGVEEQMKLLESIRADFPSPRDLVSLIVENPSDPRLKFDSLFLQKETVGDLEAKVARLEKKLGQDRIAERKLETKLHSIKTRNDIWRPSIMQYFGVVTDVVVQAGEDVLDDDFDEDWVDE